MLTRSVLLLSFVSIYSTSLWSQNVFKVKVDGCDTHQFCLDCGNPKASYDKAEFQKIIDALKSKYNLKGLRGEIGFQVLVDTLGRPCVLSHTDASKDKFTLDAIQYLNQCHWTAAMDHGKPVSASVNVIFSIDAGVLTGYIQQVDPGNIMANIKNMDPPVVYNKSYRYRNPSLKAYQITVWQKENSGLPMDMSQHAVVDKNGILWCSTINGMASFDGHEFTRLTEGNSPFMATQAANSIALDQDNNIWIATIDQVYMYDSKRWTEHTPEQTRVDGGVGHITCTAYGEVFICTNRGLSILKNGRWDSITDQNVRQLPSNRIDYAYRDRQRRLWIGTFSGTIMIDSNQQVTEFNQSATPLNSTCVTGAAEDEAGNLYFSLYEYGGKVRNRSNEGLAIFSADGKWQHLNDENSGLPSDHINSLLLDRFEHVLWIGTNESGLVRWDLKDGWEVYHSENSKVPNPHVFDLSQDSKGEVYGATYGGMIRIIRKQ
jgi:hypothetical protein